MNVVKDYAMSYVVNVVTVTVMVTDSYIGVIIDAIIKVVDIYLQMANVSIQIMVRRVLIYLVVFSLQHGTQAYETPPADKYHVDNAHSHSSQALESVPTYSKP